jgi:hypothetical protein
MGYFSQNPLLLQNMSVAAFPQSKQHLLVREKTAKVLSMY